MSQVIGPEWLGSERYDIDARLPADGATDRVAEMLQTLLVERFGLKQHREQRAT